MFPSDTHSRHDAPAIAKVDAYLFTSAVPPQGNAAGWIDARVTLVVRVETADGAVGLGEAYPDNSLDRARAAGDAVAVLVPHLLATKKVDWTSLQAAAAAERGRDSNAYTAVSAAVSALDMALWELRGVERGLPTWRLWTNRRPGLLTPYASGFPYRTRVGPQLQHDLDEAARVSQLGYRAVKVRIGRDVEEDRGRLLALLSLGAFDTVAVDANRGYTLKDAAWAMYRLPLAECAWFEEPTAQPADYAALRAQHVVPIAAGETLRVDEPLPPEQSVDILQPDAGLVGGPSAVLRIAHQTDRPVIPHVWGSAIALGCGVHLAAALSAESGSKQQLLEVDVTSQALPTFIAEPAFAIKPALLDGRGKLVAPLSVAGWGVRFDVAEAKRAADQIWTVRSGRKV